MTYEITVLRTAVKSVERLPKEVQDRVVYAIAELAETPRPSGAKNLVPREQLLRRPLVGGDSPLQFGLLLRGNLDSGVRRNAVPQPFVLQGQQVEFTLDGIAVPVNLEQQLCSSI